MALQFSSSINVSGSVVASQMTSSLHGTASYALVVSPSATASFAATASLAHTASSADNFVVRGVLPSSIFYTVSASIDFTSGSNKIGNSLANTQEITGSVGITGSLTVFTNNNPEFRVVDTGVTIGNALTDTHRVTGSLGVTGSFTVF